METTTPWVTCPNCDDLFCSLHDEHLGDCRCPPLEEWEAVGLCPYEMCPSTHPFIAELKKEKQE